MTSDAADKSGLNRRSFLKGAAAAGAAAALAGRLIETTHAQEAPAPAKPQAGSSGGKALLSSIVVSRPGSDFMVDVIKALGIDYVAANPGSSFRSLQESIVNYGGNSK